jgi:ADP-ribose pyrophosphatase
MMLKKGFLPSFRRKSSALKLHTKCINNSYLNGPARFQVPEDKVPWTVEFPEYQPVEYVSPPVAKKPVWADDPAKVAEFDYNGQDAFHNRKSLMGRYLVDKTTNRPLNPIGRTGMTERGLLGRFGPNFAADPVVTKWKRDSNGHVIKDERGRKVVEVVLIKRRDNGEWAIPGGMVEPGHTVSATLKKEFGEEALNSLEASPEEQASIQKNLDKLFAQGTYIYAGYVDDPRNTDNAWMETTVVNFHDDKGDVVEKFKLQAGDDAGQVAWVEITPGMNLYASHTDFISQTYKKLVGKSL